MPDSFLAVSSRQSHAGSRLRFSFSSSGERPLLQSIAARKYSTQQAQSALEKGVLRLLSSPEHPGQRELSQTTPVSPTFNPVNDAALGDENLYQDLNMWSFEEKENIRPPSQQGPTDRWQDSEPKWQMVNPFAPGTSDLSRRISLNIADPDVDAEFDSNWPSSPQSPGSGSRAGSVAAAARLLAGLTEQEVNEAVALSRHMKIGSIHSRRGSAKPRTSWQEPSAHPGSSHSSPLDRSSRRPAPQASNFPFEHRSSSSTVDRVHATENGFHQFASNLRQSRRLSSLYLPTAMSTASIASTISMSHHLHAQSPHQSASSLPVTPTDPLHSVADGLTILCERASSDSGRQDHHHSGDLPLCVSEDFTESRRGSIVSRWVDRRPSWFGGTSDQLSEPFHASSY